MTFFIGKEMHIDVQSTEITIDAALDPAKFAGHNRDVRAGYQAFDVSIKIHGGASAADLARLQAEVEARCPVSDNIAYATPVRISMSAA